MEKIKLGDQGYPCPGHHFYCYLDKEKCPHFVSEDREKNAVSCNIPESEKVGEINLDIW